MQTIHQAQAGKFHLSLVARRNDFVIVADDGGKFAILDPRGSNRAQAVDCWIEMVDLGNRGRLPLATLLHAQGA